MSVLIHMLIFSALKLMNWKRGLKLGCKLTMEPLRATQVDGRKRE